MLHFICEGGAAYHLWGLSFYNVCNALQKVWVEFASYDHKDRLELCSAHIQLILYVLHLCSLQKSRLVGWDHILKALDVLDIVLSFSFDNLTLKFIDFIPSRLLVSLEVTFLASSTALAKYQHLKNVVNWLALGLLAFSLPSAGVFGLVSNKCAVSSFILVNAWVGGSSLECSDRHIGLQAWALTKLTFWLHMSNLFLLKEAIPLVIRLCLIVVHLKVLTRFLLALTPRVAELSFDRVQSFELRIVMQTVKMSIADVCIMIELLQKWFRESVKHCWRLIYAAYILIFVLVIILSASKHGRVRELAVKFMGVIR